MELDKLFSLLQALDEQKVDYYVFGGRALNIHGLVRATEDVDSFVRPDRNNIDRLRTAVQQVFPDDPSVKGRSSDDLLGPYPEHLQRLRAVFLSARLLAPGFPPGAYKYPSIEAANADREAWGRLRWNTVAPS